MTEYLMLFIISLIFAFIYDKLSTTNKHIKMFVAFFIFFSFFFIQAIRYNVGTDFLGTYTNEYYKVLYGTINNKLEWGFTFLYKFIVYFDMDKQWIFVFSSFIINFFVFKSIFEHSKSAFISLAVFFLGSFFFFSMNGIRQSIAMAIFYYSIPLIKEKNFKKYLILNCIGFLFHSSAILFIPLYFILTHKFTHMQRIITILILIVVVKMLTPTILKLISLTKYSGYLVNSNYNFAGKITLSSIVNIIVYLLFEINNKKNIQDLEYNIYLNIHFIGVVITILSTSLVIIFRLFLSFRFVEFISIPYLIYYVRKNNVAIKNRMIIYLSIIVIFFSYFTYSIAIKNYNDTIPYQTIFQN